METKGSKVRRYKHIDRQMVYDDLQAAAKSKRMTVTRYSISIGGDSRTPSRILRGDINPTEYMLRQLAHDMRDAGVKRHWKDYLLLEPEVEAVPEPEQVEMDLDAISQDHDLSKGRIEDEFLLGLQTITRAVVRAYAAGYDFKVTVERVGRS